MSPTSNRPDRERRARQANRMARILGVLRLIQSRGRWNAAGIAAELGCTVRTVYRDLQTLEFAGVPGTTITSSNAPESDPTFVFLCLT